MNPTAIYQEHYTINISNTYETLRVKVKSISEMGVYKNFLKLW